MSRTVRTIPRRHIDRRGLKADARTGRRAADRAVLDALRTGRTEPEDATAWTRNGEVSDRWAHD